METKVFQQNQRCEVRDLGGVAGALQYELGMKQQNYIAQTFTKGSHPMIAQQPQTYEQTETAKTLNCFNNSESRAEELVVGYYNHPQDSRVTKCNDGVFATLPKQLGTGGGNAPFVQYHYAVRRITPIEGERLQGFADNWTRPCFTAEQIADDALVDQFVGIHQNWSIINGKADAKPKSRKSVREWMAKISSAECPDGPRYKAIGNSMSVNVMQWIGEVIQEAYDKETAE